MIRHKLHRNLANSMRFLCDSVQDMAAVFSISPAQAKKILEGRPVFMPQDSIDIIKSVLRNQLQYALPARINRLLDNQKTRLPFIAWVHSMACMMDIYDTLQPYQDQCDFLNCADPFLIGLYTVDAGMREVRQLLVQIHQKCPQYDALFFHGTRLLEGLKGIKTDAPELRVPSSVDVLSLSPEDERIKEKLLRRQHEHH